jgi:hypothetical protein
VNQAKIGLDYDNNNTIDLYSTNTVNVNNRTIDSHTTKPLSDTDINKTLIKNND